MKTNRKKMVISGSANLQSRITYWKDHFEQHGYEITVAPQPWNDSRDFQEQLTELYKDFYTAIDECDAFFLMNEDKYGVAGYIGANATAELIYAVMLNVVKNKNIEIYIANIPEERVFAYDEVTSYLRAGWIAVYEPAN